MKFLKTRIIIENKNKYLKIEKKENFLRVLMNIIFFLIVMLILKYIKPIIARYNIKNFEFILSWSFMIISFVIYYFSTLVFLSNEILELNNERIIIKKFLFSYCYYKKEILLEKILKISYKNPTYIIITCIFMPLLFKENNSIIIQANTGLEEDEEIYFGIGINLAIYGELVKTLKEILNDKVKNIEFIYYK